jgi:hypothetical protein
MIETNTWCSPSAPARSVSRSCASCKALLQRTQSFWGQQEEWFAVETARIKLLAHTAEMLSICSQPCGQDVDELLATCQARRFHDDQECVQVVEIRLDVLGALDIEGRG